MSLNEEWLNTNKEVAIDPDLPICDPHHHFWDYKKDSVEPTYLLPEILKDINSGHNIVSTVFIECGAMYNQNDPVEKQVINETEFVNGIAAMSHSGLYGKTKIAAGIVGSAPLLLGDKVASILDKHIAITPDRFKGIRSQAAMHPDGSIPVARARPPEGVYLDKKFHEGFTHLAKRNLSFEAWCYHPQLPQLIELAKKFTNTCIILNHFGGPLGVGSFEKKEEETYEFWIKQIKELSKCENVVAKLGGIAMEINGYNWHKNTSPPSGIELINRTKKYYENTIELFGVDRCMFESNFPVDKVSCSYVNLWNGFKNLTKDYSDSEKTKLFHDNATRVYKIKE